MLHSFTVVDYDWHAIGITKGEALRRGQDAATAANQFHGAFIPKNNAITGLKWYGGDVFVTVPRWLPGVPSTLNKVIVNETCDGGTCSGSPSEHSSASFWWSFSLMRTCGAGAEQALALVVVQDGISLVDARAIEGFGA